MSRFGPGSFIAVAMKTEALVKLLGTQEATVNVCFVTILYLSVFLYEITTVLALTINHVS